MPVYNVPNLASNNRGSTTQNYYSSLNRPNPVGNQLGNQTGTAPSGWNYRHTPEQRAVMQNNGMLSNNYLSNPYGQAGHGFTFLDQNAHPLASSSQGNWNSRFLEQYVTPGSEGGGGQLAYRYNNEANSLFDELNPGWRERGSAAQGAGIIQIGNPSETSFGGPGEIKDPSLIRYDDRVGYYVLPEDMTPPEDSNLTRTMPAIVAAAFGVPALMHAGVIGAGAGAASTAPEVAGGTSTLGTTGLPGGVASGVAPAVPGAGGTITGVGGLPTAAVGGGVGVPAAGSVTGSLAAGGTAAAGAGAAAAGGNTIAQTLAQYGITGRDVAGVLGGALSLANSGRTQRGLNAAADRADPFGQYRGQAGEDLMKFMEDPSYIYNRPGYIARRDQGEQSINRAAAGKGYFRSPNMLFDLSKFNSGLAAQEFDAEYRRLAAMAGVDINPATAAGLQAQGVNSSTSMRSAGIDLITGTIFDYLFRNA